MNKTVAILFLLIITTTAFGQKRQRLRERAEELQYQVDSVRRIIRGKADSVRVIHYMDSLLDRRDERARAKYDTNYIAKPLERWTFKLRANVTGNHLLLRGRGNGESLHSELDAAHKLTFSFALGYRGLTLSFAANPLKWAGKYKDMEYNIVSYGRKFGFDASYSQANTFGGNFKRGDLTTDIESGNVTQKLFTASGYYVFNNRRFSYPAAFSQSMLQLRSAGSWLLAASLNGGVISTDESIPDGWPSPKIKFVNLGIGGGYGYNYVHGRWLLHGSLTSELVCGTWSRMELQSGEEVRTPWRFPNFIVQGRIAAIYNWRTCFTGFTATSNFSSMGDKDELDIYHVRWLARAFFGVRF